MKQTKLSNNKAGTTSAAGNIQVSQKAVPAHELGGKQSQRLLSQRKAAEIWQTHLILALQIQRWNSTQLLQKL